MQAKSYLYNIPPDLGLALNNILSVVIVAHQPARQIVGGAQMR